MADENRQGQVVFWIFRALRSLDCFYVYTEWNTSVQSIVSAFLNCTIWKQKIPKQAAYACARSGIFIHRNKFSNTLRARLKIAFCEMCVTVCGKFVPKSGGVAGYADWFWGEFPAKRGVQIAGMNFQTRSNSAFFSVHPKTYSRP